MEQEKQHHELSDEDYSKAVQKRIGKEVAKRKAAEDSFRVSQDSFVAAQEEASVWRQKTRDAEARIEEVEAERIQLTKREKKDLLKQAIEDGDTEKQAEYLEEITRVASSETEYERRKRERAESIEQEVAAAKASASKPPPAAEPEEPPPLHASAMAFMDRNKDWFDTNADAASRAVEIENELHIKGGMDLGDDLYKKLEEQLFDEMPDLTPDPGDEEMPASPVSDSLPPVAPTSRGQGRRPPRRENGNYMSASAKETMRRYGLDPDNANHIKGFLKHRVGV